MRYPFRRWPYVANVGLALAFASTPASAQFDHVPVPPPMAAVGFMVGQWTVDGTFRTPDHVGSDRTLWYLTGGGGVTRFDGEGWTAYTPGQSAVADSILREIRARAEPFRFTHHRDVSLIQDGFSLLIDEGRTSGSTVVFFDTERSAWVATGFHAPTNGVTTAMATHSVELPIFEGRATDRRGERIFRRHYERHGLDRYTIRTDISFDGGTTWIDDQIVKEVHRRR